MGRGSYRPIFLPGALCSSFGAVMRGFVDPYVRHGVAIVGPYGNIWTERIFKDEEEAKQHIKIFWQNVNTFDISQWSVVPATLSVTAKIEQKQAERISLGEKENADQKTKTST